MRLIKVKKILTFFRKFDRKRHNHISIKKAFHFFFLKYIKEIHSSSVNSTKQILRFSQKYKLYKVIRKRKITCRNS